MGRRMRYEKDTEYSSRNIRRNGAFGVALVISGVLLILGRLNILPEIFMDYIFSWQSLLIVLGLIGFASNWHTWIFNLVLILIGSFFLLTEIYTVSYEVQQLFWPIILVLGGFSLIMKRKSHEKWTQKFREGNRVNNNFFQRDYIFGGGKNLITSKDFTGGSVSVVFGGSELNFSEAGLAEGTHVLEINAVFGGINIIVPRTWDVSLEVSGILGGFNDERSFYNTDEIDTSRKLIIKGSAVFGGGDIKNV